MDRAWESDQVEQGKEGAGHVSSVSGSDNCRTQACGQDKVGLWVI